MNRQKTRKLNAKAAKALELLKNEEEWKKRIKELEGKSEYGYALLVLWNMIEAAVKLLWYNDHIRKPYPDALDNEVLNPDWQVIKDISENHKEELRDIFKITLPGTQKSKSQCLQELRNDIAHLNFIPTKRLYNKRYSVAWAIWEILNKKLPTAEALEEKLNAKEESSGKK